MKISKKYKKFPEDYNKIKFNEICNQYPLLKKFFDLNYLEVFQHYYYNNQKLLNHIIFEGINVTLSPKTKSFYYLMEKNKNNIGLLNNIVHLAYF